MRQCRGKRIDNGGWVKGWLWHNAYNDHWFIMQEASTGLKDMISFRVAPTTVLEDTGLKDKNGVEIYKGDIVRMEYCWREPSDREHIIDEGYYVGAVKILATKGACIGQHKRTSQYKPDTLIAFSRPIAAYRCEVIGNIHDNPELLENNQ